MIADLSPGLILIGGGLLLPLLPRAVRGWWMLLLPVLAFAQLVGLPTGNHGIMTLSGLELTTLRIDSLSRIFGYIFLIAAALTAIYALHDRDVVQQVAGLAYAGSAVGAVFAGDLVTLFIYWEGTAIASVFLIWASRTEKAYTAGMRYLIIQVGSGVLLLAGVMLHYRATGSIAFGSLGLDGSVGKLLIFAAFGIKCAFPLLHNWLQDAYPEATVTGTVMLSAFTTKLAVYALARGFAGTEILVPIGAVMTAFPIFYAVIENDLRRVLAYSLNNQLGFMVVGIGIGTEMALNGTAAHAFCHILYKALLFMSMGAVLLRVGTVKGSELGGLFKSMPWTAGFCMVGAASISAFPLFSGFVSKSLIIAAALEGGYFWTFLTLLFASAGVFHHSGIKIPYFAFFAHDSGKRCAEAPTNMLIAMGITATLCIGIGVYPQPLYALLPYKVDFAPYTIEHVVTQLQLLMFSALAFTVLMRTGIYPPELRSTNLDTDWFYRKPGKALLQGVAWLAATTSAGISQGIVSLVTSLVAFTRSHHGPDGIFGRSWPTGTMAFWTAVLLGAVLLHSYL
ncbi:MAG: Na(+)/H(+) antiporter subunit D [Hyphomicrobiaceae bacterium]|nr:Na(+)/H(+) antiporter subunit D [Hyphomicrobiaceae bacterium]